MGCGCGGSTPATPRPRPTSAPPSLAETPVESMTAETVRLAEGGGAK